MKLFLIILSFLIIFIHAVNAKVLSACEGCKNRNHIPVTSTASEGRVVQPEVNHHFFLGRKPTDPVPYEPARGSAMDTQGLWVGPNERMAPDPWYQEW